MQLALYDTIGKTYDMTRKADPQIIDRIQENQEEVKQECKYIQHDIKSGKIKEIIQSYNSKLGDYIFVPCSKK